MQNGISRTVKSVDVILNPKILAAFEKKKQEFKKKGIPCDPIYAYHGTNPSVIDEILKTNFDMKFVGSAHGQTYGRGHYFSEYPGVSFGYGEGLIFCELLTGKEFNGPNLDWEKRGNSKVNFYQFFS